MATILDSALLQGLSALQELSSGTLVFGSYSTTVFKSSNLDTNRKMQDAGYWDTIDNMYVIAKASDVSDWGLIAQKSLVSLDGTHYIVGNSINKNSSVWVIYLRKKI